MSRSFIHAFGAFAVIGVSVFVLSGNTRSSLAQFSVANQAAVFTVDTVTTADLHSKYEASKSSADEKVRIFLMPGHEPEFGGAEYKGVIERDLNVKIAEYLQEYLSQDGRYEVVLGRNEKAWNEEIMRYFAENWTAIDAWRAQQASIMKNLLSKGEIDLVESPVAHQTVSNDVANRLYGINKWIGENDFDLAIHIHVNDYGSRKKRSSGEFTGYVIYVPENQYSNSAAAKAVASSISDRLGQFFPQSNAKREQGGIVEDQELIALGRYNTADSPALLIEYGYIYETQFQDKDVRERALKEYAYQTYLGIQDFFVTGKAAAPAYSSATLPYTWNKNISDILTQDPDIYALQIALRAEGYYPAQSKTLNDCPVSGLFGGCTKRALAAFQKDNGLADEEGVLGEATRKKLNILW
jgi:N-acetylmuramoyl-L-alanine amidase